MMIIFPSSYTSKRDVLLLLLFVAIYHVDKCYRSLELNRVSPLLTCIEGRKKPRIMKRHSDVTYSCLFCALLSALSVVLIM